MKLQFGPKDPKTGRSAMTDVPGSEFAVDADLVLLAMGFLGPVKNGLLEDFGVELDERGNVKADKNKNDQRSWGFHRRRYDARTVAGGLGHPRRPRRGAGCPQLFNGRKRVKSEIR